MQYSPPQLYRIGSVDGCALASATFHRCCWLPTLAAHHQKLNSTLVPSVISWVLHFLDNPSHLISPLVLSKLWGNSEFVSSGIEAALALPSFNFPSSLSTYPAAPVTSALSPSRLLILISCGCFILFLAWLVVDVRVSSRHEPSPARSGLTPHMDLIPHLNNQVLLVRDFPSCDYQLRQNCHGSLNSTPPRPTSPLFYSLHFSYVRTTLYLLYFSSSPSS